MIEEKEKKNTEKEMWIMNVFLKGTWQTKTNVWNTRERCVVVVVEWSNVMLQFISR